VHFSGNRPLATEQCCTAIADHITLTMRPAAAAPRRTADVPCGPSVRAAPRVGRYHPQHATAVHRQRRTSALPAGTKGTRLARRRCPRTGKQIGHRAALGSAAPDVDAVLGWTRSTVQRPDHRRGIGGMQLVQLVGASALLNAHMNVAVSTGRIGACVTVATRKVRCFDTHA
jgi:hypothetical protein